MKDFRHVCMIRPWFNAPVLSTSGIFNLLQWVGKQKQKVYHKPYQGIDHMQILRDPDVISYVVELVQNITKKNMRLSQRKAENLFRLEKNRKDKEKQRIFKTKANDIVMPRKWFDAIYANKEEFMEQQSNSRVNNQHPNSIQALLNEDYTETESWRRPTVY